MLFQSESLFDYDSSRSNVILSNFANSAQAALTRFRRTLLAVFTAHAIIQSITAAMSNGVAFPFIPFLTLGTTYKASE